jgi:hypothetical protein
VAGIQNGLNPRNIKTLNPDFHQSPITSHQSLQQVATYSTNCKTPTPQKSPQQKINRALS